MHDGALAMFADKLTGGGTVIGTATNGNFLAFLIDDVDEITFIEIALNGGHTYQ